MVQLLNAQSDLSSQVQELRRNGGSEILTAAEAQLSEFSQVQQRLASGTISVAALRSEVTAIVAAATAVAGQARVSSASHAQHAEAALNMASAEARRTVDAFVTDFYEKKIFDPYLRFASVEDEAAYREREEAYRRAIETARAEGTPEGDLRAAKLSIAQLDDAGANGADQSPDFQATRDHLNRTVGPLENAIARSASAADHADTIFTTESTSPLPSDIVPADLLARIRSAGLSASDADTPDHGLAQRATETSRGVGRS